MVQQVENIQYFIIIMWFVLEWKAFLLIIRLNEINQKNEKKKNNRKMLAITIGIETMNFVLNTQYLIPSSDT